MKSHRIDDLLDALATEAGEDNTLITAADRLEQLRAHITGEVAYLLETNVALLMSALYRIDVNEKELLSCLSDSSSSELPDRIAELVLRRQLAKVAMRKRTDAWDANRANPSTERGSDG